MNYITTYNKYTTINIDNDIFLLESKGIPNTLKYFLNNIIINLSGKTEIFININESDFKIKKLKIKLNNSKSNYYGFSKFGIFTQNDELIDTSINIYFNFNNLNIKLLKKTILHELLHIYEIYQRYKNKTSKKLQWDFINEIQKLRNEYNDKFIKDFMFIIYLSSDQEINARIAETYSVLYDEKEIDTNKLKKVLLNSNVWELKNKIKEFNINNYHIDYDLLMDFFIKLNNIMNKLSVKQFKIFKLPKDKNDIDNLLKKYKSFFTKKSIYFEKKLIKIISEVSNDVKKILFL